MINSFDTEVAKDVGINAAIIYFNIKFWCEHNRTNDANYYDGYYWTYNSTKAFCEQFPYMSKDQINYALKKLEDAKYIITGNYNKSTYDRTKWYADIRANDDGKSITSISYQSEMDCRDSQNGFGDNPKPIPNINTNNNQITNLKENVKRKFDAIAYLDTIDVIAKDPELKDAFVSFIELRKSMHKSITTEDALKRIIKKAWELGNGNRRDIIAVLNQSIVGGYQGLFELKGNANNSHQIAPRTPAQPKKANDTMAVLDALYNEAKAREMEAAK